MLIYRDCWDERSSFLYRTPTSCARRNILLMFACLWRSGAPGGISVGFDKDGRGGTGGVRQKVEGRRQKAEGERPAFCPFAFYLLPFTFFLLSPPTPRTA